MAAFIARRLATGVLLLLTVCTIAFYLLYLGSDSVAHAILGVEATKADIARFNISHGLDQPFLQQYWNWVTHAIRGDFGEPWTFTQSVTEAITSRMGVTLILASTALFFSAVVSILLGVTAALRGGWVDRVVQVLGLVGFAVPNFLLAFLLVALFAVKYRVFNAVGWVPPSQDLGEFAKSAILPVFALAFAGIASVSQQVRGAVKDTLQLDFVRTLRTGGLSYQRVVFKHALRNAAAPALSILGLQFVGLLGGAVIIEQIFAIPGLGQFSVSATGAKDLPAVMGIVTMTALIVITVNLIIDLLSAALNPKVRLT